VLVARGGSELTVEVAGVGYRLTVTPSTALAAGPEGAEVFVWVHHHIREGAQTLYGFTTPEERDLFEVLVSTHGVGPALGLSILSTLDPDGLRRAVAAEDLAALCLVPGVGRKTAQRLLVELASRLDVGEVDLRVAPPGPGLRAGGSAHADVREALVGLGYGPDEIAAVLRELPADGDAAELIRTALRRLAAA
jgi:Holliday junction DNA helicase RuvA